MIYRVVNDFENYGRDQWYTNEEDREFQTEAEAVVAAKHLNAEWKTDTFKVEET